MPAAHPTSSWTDERLDDLATSMRDGFARVDRRFEQVDQRFAQVDERFDRLEDRISSLQRVLVAGMFGLTGTLIATMLAIVLRLG